MQAQQHWFQGQARDLALADYMLSQDPRHLARIQEIDRQLLEQSVPDVFDDGDFRNVLTLARKQMLRLCAALGAEGINNPQEMTLVALHSQVELLNERRERPAAG